MVTVDPAEPAEWVQLDDYGRVIGKPFHGTAAELRARLRQGLEDVATAGLPTVEDVWVCRPLGDKEISTLVTMTTPWGRYRWIPRPPQPSEEPWTLLFT